MGRVRKYKKVKSVDTSNRRVREDKRYVEHNLPPDVLNHHAQRLNADGTVKRKKKARLPEWARQDIKETAMKEREEERLRQTGISEESSMKKKKVPIFKSKKSHESMKMFEERIKKSTNKALIEQSKKVSSTAIKRKQHFKEKDLRKKMKKSGTWDEYVAQKEREELGLSQERDFLQPEAIQFGETVDAPPNFSTLPKSKGVAVKNKKPWIKSENQHTPQKNMHEMEALRSDAQAAYERLKKRRRSENLGHEQYDNL